MRLITVKLQKIKNNLYVKIPKIIKEALFLKENEEIEISIHSEPSFAQGELWNQKNEEKNINVIRFQVSQDTYTVNMFNRLYIPEKYRFFLPAKNVNFILSTNVGDIPTHLTSNGYISKGLRYWFKTNGPIEYGQHVVMYLLDESKNHYELQIVS